MKKVVALVFAGMFLAQVSGTAFAGSGQGQGDPEKGQPKKVEKMVQALNLTPEQKEKVAVIMKESGEKTKAETQKMREACKAIRLASDQKIKEVLTPEQAQKYDTLQTERTHKKGKRAKATEGTQK